MKTNHIYQGDCLEVMKTFPDESIDLVVTSPPYDELRDYKGYSFNFEGIAKELYRVIKQGSVVVWVVGDMTTDGSESGSSFRQALFFKDLGFNLHDTMIYLKNSPPYPSQGKYYQVFEYMFILSKGKPKTFNPIVDRENRWQTKWSDKRTRREKDGSLKEAPVTWEFKPLGVRFNVWKYNTGAENSTRDKIAYEHPATFPEKLAEDHIISWSNEGDIVLDPMCGSGTTCKMAKYTNRKYIGIDTSSDYCKIAEERLSQEVFDFK